MGDTFNLEVSKNDTDSISSILNLHLSNSSYMNVNVPNDSLPHMKENNARSRRSSCTINLMLESLKVINNNEQPLKSYQKRLEQEIREWRHLWSNTNSIITNEEPLRIGVEILSEENRKYLDAAPALQVFIADSINFRKRSKLFLETQYLPIQEACDRLLEVCSHLQESSKQRLINKRAALDI